MRLSSLIILLMLIGCKAKRPELHPCNEVPPTPYPGWCISTHRTLPEEVRRKFPPSPSPKPSVGR